MSSASPTSQQKFDVVYELTSSMRTEKRAADRLLRQQRDMDAVLNGSEGVREAYYVAKGEGGFSDYAAKKIALKKEFWEAIETALKQTGVRRAAEEKAYAEHIAASLAANPELRLDRKASENAEIAAKKAAKAAGKEDCC